MDTDKFGTGTVIAWIINLALIAIAGLGAIYLISILVRPVIAQLAETFSMVSSGSHRDIHSLAVLCIILIGVIGLAKVLTRKKR
jgi:hypothetical protein